MNRSESIANLATALSIAQGEMGGAKKDSSNPFFKSKYADLAAVIDAIRIPFSKNGLCYSQDAEVDDSGFVVVDTIIMHKSGEWKSSRLKMRPVKEDPQGIGSCITYARRYGLQAACGVPSEDDDGNSASNVGGKEKVMNKNEPAKTNDIKCPDWLEEASLKGLEALQIAFASIPASKDKTLIWRIYGESLKVAAEKAENSLKNMDHGQESKSPPDRQSAMQEIEDMASDLPY